MAEGSVRRAAVLVGYNDVFESTVDSAALGEMVAETATLRCAVWLTLPERTGGQRPPTTQYPDHLVRAWNRRIRSLAAEYPNVHVVEDWAKAVDDASVAERDRLLEDRGVHPNVPGRLRLARIYRNAVARSCPP